MFWTLVGVLLNHFYNQWHSKLSLCPYFCHSAESDVSIVFVLILFLRKLTENNSDWHTQPFCVSHNSHLYTLIKCVSTRAFVKCFRLLNTWLAKKMISTKGFLWNQAWNQIIWQYDIIFLYKVGCRTTNLWAYLSNFPLHIIVKTVDWQLLVANWLKELSFEVALTK